MNRYDWDFRSLPPAVRASAIYRVDFARGAILKHRSHGFGPEDDENVIRQFDLSGLDEFWCVELSEPMSCDLFAGKLAIHFLIIEDKPEYSEEEKKTLGPASLRAVDTVRAQILSAIRAARKAGEPWLFKQPDRPPGQRIGPIGFVPRGVIVVPPDPPADGIDLSKLLIKPRAAAEWLLAMPKRRHVVPRSLASYLARPLPMISVDTAPAADLPPSKRGRPNGTGYKYLDEPIARRMIDLFEQGRATSLSDAAWLEIGRDGKGAIGIGEPKAKVERLVKVANRLKGAGRNRV